VSRRRTPLVDFLSALVGIVTATASVPAHAQSAPPPAERLQVYSRYEQETIDEVLTRLGATADPAPEGKVVERVQIERLDVFERRDLLPPLLNIFHVTTRDSVVRREVLLREGDPYRQVLVDDTIRNLRRTPGVPQLSVVLVVAVAGSAPGRVVVVVITKDVWSLRTNWSAVVTPGGIEQFELQPAETNFLGTHQIANLLFVLEPSTYTLGVGYMVPRLDSSRVAVQAGANVVLNRQSGQAEGTYGALVAGQPLFSGATDWAWNSGVQWQDFIARRYVNAKLYEYRDPATGDTLPFQYRSRAFAAAYEVTRSFGWDINHDVSLAASVSRAVYQTRFAGADPRTAADFVSAYVPVSDTRVGPHVQYHTYDMRFVRVIDFDTLALQEDYRLGHDVLVSVFPSFRALGSSRDVLGLYGAAQYTWAVRDGLFRLSMQASVDSQVDRVSDAWIDPMAHLATPTIAGVGRFVLDGSLLWRVRNYLNQTSILGGDDRLRGYPTNFFVGSSLFTYNVEFRSRPVEVLSCEVGAVAFYDVGDAFTGFDHFVPYQSLGAGIRAVFPWLDRYVFRADIGFPIERPIDPATRVPVAPYSFLISFGQAFATPTVSPAPVLPTGQGPDSP
jgi:hypothetical protein